MGKKIQFFLINIKLISHTIYKFYILLLDYHMKLSTFIWGAISIGLVSLLFKSYLIQDAY